MYEGRDNPRRAELAADVPLGTSPAATAALALGRVRKLLDSYVPGMSFDPARLRADLDLAMPEPDTERQRLFALGWLAWLAGDFPGALPWLEETVARATDEQAIEAAYWRARVQLRLGHPDVLPGYERVLRARGGSPQATIWLIELLWRLGQVDRAEQVWKAVRGNRRVSSCPEAALVEARLLLRRDELPPAERLLRDAEVTSGVLWVERLLLLAWLHVGQGRAEEARTALHQARQGPYPGAALTLWAARIEQRLQGECSLPAEAEPHFLDEYLAGQEARLAGRRDAAVQAYQAALACPAVEPFARHGLVALKEQDPAALLASSPGLFLAARCRARLSLTRFLQRQASAAEWLECLRQAAAQGYLTPRLEAFRILALALQERSPPLDRLNALAAQSRNGLRAAVELAVRGLPPQDVVALLVQWSRGPFASHDDLRRLLGRQLLRAALLLPQVDETVRRTIEDLLPGEALVVLLSPSTDRHAPGTPSTPRSDNPLVQLDEAARKLASGLDEHERESWRQQVRVLRGGGRQRGLAQGLLVQEAAERGDGAGVAALLEETDAWRGGSSLPPSFVLRAVESVAAAQSSSSAWQRSLARWLDVWDPSALAEHAGSLLALAGRTPLSAREAQPPPGLPAVPWLLHQAARAVGRGDPAAALIFVQRVLGPEGEPDQAAARAALPELERWAPAQRLADVLGGNVSAGQLVDLVDHLRGSPEGLAVLAAVERGDRAEAWTHLEALAQRVDLLPRLAHHLALVLQREALRLEEEGDEHAVPCWRLAWVCWLRVLSADVRPEAWSVLLDWLLAELRRRLDDLLARNAMSSARAVWELLEQLPSLTTEEALRRELDERAHRFRDELATDCLTATRDVLRLGEVPTGWRSDYEKGLGQLRRLLSLDRDNPRLLTALVEICTDWLVDLYHASSFALLHQMLERFTPFALHLARRVQGGAGDLAARAALADFWKFRGLAAADRAQQRTLYQEALEFNPGNANVRALLAQLEEGAREPT